MATTVLVLASEIIHLPRVFLPDISNPFVSLVLQQRKYRFSIYTSTSLLCFFYVIQQLSASIDCTNSRQNYFLVAHS